MLMVLTAESPGFALRNFTESVQWLLFQLPSQEYMATTCLDRQQPDLSMHAHLEYHLKERKKTPSVSDPQLLSGSGPSYIHANRDNSILA